jgi:hypothetical protein
VKPRFHGCHPPDELKVDEGGAQNDEDKFWRTPAVEKDAEEEERDVFEFPWHQVIGDQEHRKEAQKKDYAAEYHRAGLLHRI